MVEFKVGDSVRLKTGGPAMTVDMAGDHYAACVRRDATGVDACDVYHPDDLRLDDDRGDAPGAAPIVTKSAPAFNLGDVVRLKSGGPAMTVAGVDSKVSVYGVYSPREFPEIACQWFAAFVLSTATFPAACLELAAPDPR